MERVLKDLVERLKKAYPNELVSVVLYGSAAAGDHHGRFSDINILCVLAEVGRSQLAAAAPVFRWWRDLGNPAPLLLSQTELRTSADCFAIEFHDIKERHRILHGADLVSGLEVDNRFYRAQVEHELRAKLLRLRQKAGAILADKELMRGLLVDSLSTFTVLIRHALRLTGEDPGFTKREILAAAEQKFGIDPQPFLRLLEVREQKAKPGSLDPGPVFDTYLKEIQVVIDAVDRLGR
jgi:predicted nucleotidyltransferase